METYITRKQVREVNRKLFANDLIYSEDSSDQILEEIISNIIQRYDPKDQLANVPSIIEIKSVNNKTLDNIMLLDKKSAIIQVNNSLIADRQVLEIMQQLKKIGYKITVELNRNDTVFTIATILADIIKIDINNIPDALANQTMYFGFNGKVLVYNIDSPTDYEAASALHADLYEGSYITEGSSIKIEATDNTASINFVEVVKILSEEDMDIKDLAIAISKDVIMTAQVIRLANSAYYMGREKISSIEQAIVRVGLNTLKKWVFLLKFNRRTNNNEELLQLAYSRALFCEKIAKHAKRITISETDSYLIGLFSTLDALTGKSIDKQLNAMGLSPTIEEALIYREGTGGLILNLVKSYEEANWDRVDRYVQQIGIDKGQLSNIYFNCVDEVAKFWSGLKTVEGTR